MDFRGLCVRWADKRGREPYDSGIASTPSFKGHL